MPKYRIERLDKKIHNRTKFDCGEESLNRYLRKLSGQHLKSGISRTYVATEQPSENVIGYYSISMAQIDCEESSKSALPKPPTGLLLPCALIGRLAVDRAFAGKGLGEFLLMNAHKRIVLISDEIGVYAVLAHALNEESAGFWAKYGFQKLEDNGRTMVLGLKAVKKVFS